MATYNQSIMNTRGLSLDLLVFTKKTSTGKDLRAVTFYKGVTKLNVSSFITLGVSYKEEEEYLRESCALSYFDLSKLKRSLPIFVDAIMQEDAFIESEHIERGTILTMSEEMKELQLFFTARSGKSQLVFEPAVVYSKKNDCYQPMVAVTVNITEATAYVPLDDFQSIVDVIVDFNLSLESKLLTSICLTNENNYKASSSYKSRGTGFSNVE